MADRDAAPRNAGRWWKLLLGPLLAGIVLLLRPGDDGNVARMAAIAVWMAAWWVTEAVAIPVTAMLPLVLVPLAGVQRIDEVAPTYGRPTIYLFLGGFLLALGLQASGVHRRIAFWIVHKVGGQPQRVVLGFMIASAALSMWISNTATVMVLMPIGLSVIMAAKDRGVTGKPLKLLGVTIMLGIAYAADIGGMGMLVGTPPNLIYKEQLVRLLPEAPPPSFADWMMIACRSPSSSSSAAGCC
jgi:sodium-dependent dicarboxylate transporter 2/3/5